MLAINRKWFLLSSSVQIFSYTSPPLAIKILLYRNTVEEAINICSSHYSTLERKQYSNSLGTSITPMEKTIWLERKENDYGFGK